MTENDIEADIDVNNIFDANFVNYGKDTRKRYK